MIHGTEKRKILKMDPKLPQPWKTDIVNRFSITKDSMDLIIDQSTKVLIETVETAKIISKRADSLLAILLPLFSALIVYVSGADFTRLHFLPLTSLCAFVFVLMSLFFCVLNLRKYTIAIPGEYPKNILQSQFIDNYVREEYVNRQYISIGIAICENIQARITANDRINKIRMRNNTLSLYLLCAIPLVCPLVSYVILSLTQHHCVLVI